MSPLQVFTSFHRRRKVLNIGGPRFRILGGGGGGGQGGGGKLYTGCKLIGATAPKSVPNNYIFNTLKTDNIAKLRIELKRILLEIPSNKIKGTYIIKLVLL